MAMTALMGCRVRLFSGLGGGGTATAESEDEMGYELETLNVCERIDVNRESESS